MQQRARRTQTAPAPYSRWTRNDLAAFGSGILYEEHPYERARQRANTDLRGDVEFENPPANIRRRIARRCTTETRLYLERGSRPRRLALRIDYYASKDVGMESRHVRKPKEVVGSNKSLIVSYVRSLLGTFFFTFFPKIIRSAL